MKILICGILFTFLLVFSMFCFGQNKNDTIDIECQKGIDSAKIDIQRGEYKYLIFGYLTNPIHTFSKLMYKEHNIKVVYMGCVVFEKEECYSNFMDKKINEKYGNNSVDKLWQKAKYMDSVGLGNRNAVFEEGNEKMYQLIYSNLDWKKIELYKNKEDKKNRVFVKIHIDTLGNVKVDSIFKTTSLELKKEIKRVIELLPKWTTATKNGKVIEQKFSIALFFSEEIRKKYGK